MSAHYRLGIYRLMHSGCTPKQHHLLSIITLSLSCISAVFPLQSKQSLTEVPRSIQAASKESSVSAEALKAVLHPLPNAGTYYTVCHDFAAEVNTAVLATSATVAVACACQFA